MEAAANYSSISRGPAANPARYQQVAQILKGLRDELEKSSAKLNLPTTWMLDNLVSNCPLSDFESCHWEHVVTTIMYRLRTRTDAVSHQECTLRLGDGETALFPNDELFDEQDTFDFCNAVIKQLQERSEVVEIL